MKFLALAFVANSILIASARDSNKVREEVKELLEEVKEEIEDNLPESNRYLSLVV